MNKLRHGWVAVLVGCVIAGCDSEDEARELRNRVTVATQNFNVAEISSKNTVLESGRSYSLELYVGTDTPTLEHTADANWKSSNPEIATVTDFGVVTGLSDGEVTISSNFGSLSDSLNLRVSSAPLTSITVNAPATLNQCDSTQLSAIGLFEADNDSERNITDTVNWVVTSDTNTPGVFSNATDGLFRSSNFGSALITASRDNLSGEATIAIAENLQALTLTPDPADSIITTRARTQFSVTAVYSDTDETPDVTDNVQWSVSDLSRASVDDTLPDKGLFKARVNGDVTLNVSCGDIGLTKLVEVGDPRVVQRIKFEIDEDPFEFDFTDIDTLQLRALAVLETQEEVFITEELDWIIVERENTLLDVSNEEGSKGELTIDGPGSIKITVKYDLDDNDLFNEDDSIFSEPTITIRVN